MSESISGKEAKLAWAEGYSVQVATGPDKFRTLNSGDSLGIFDSGNYFRLRPHTITINDKELPKPSFTCHSTSNSNIIEIGFNTEQEARDFHLQFRRAWK